ncbi:hypothetical protein CBR_g66 [Chara braunii]|uniref:Dynein heavy chain linker domain-containing protein n=1 Tax=Chara braunii TaxID=69332 RepID=A0A388JLQ6_CHABU|nr:hypothetical protein CBR_g66 [Chara braunii]|eukprot:GBG58665.1 hypothetical protein CBR_g66 [Chara braunii]
MDQVLALMTKLSEEVAVQQNQAKRINKYQQLFQVTESRYDDLYVVVDEIELKRAMWSGLKATEIDDFLDLGDETEQDGASETSDGRVVAPIKKKARGTGKQKIDRGESFTLGLLLQNNVMEHKEQIAQISVEATQEGALEELLRKVQTKWADIEFTVKLYKESKDVYILGSVEDVIMALEDSMVTMSTITASSATSATATPMKFHISSRATSAVLRQPQLMLRRSRCIATREGRAVTAEQPLPLPLPSEMEAQGNPTVDNAASDSPREVCSTNPLVPQVQQVSSTATPAGALDAAPVRQQGETMTAFMAGLATYMQQVQEEQRREAAAEAARLNAIARDAEQRRWQHAEAAANHNKAQQDATSVLMQLEAAHTAALQAWNVDPAETTEPIAEEQTKAALTNMMHRVILTYNWQQVELAQQAHVICGYEETLKSLPARLDMLEKDDVPHWHTTSSSTDPSIRELEGRMDHLVALVVNLNSFQRLATISQQIAALQADLRQLQRQPTGTCNNMTSKQYKMLKFSIDKFDDYHKVDPISLRQGFTNELSIHLVSPESKISALYVCSTGASQVWLNHLAQTEGVEVTKLYTKITWESKTEKWRKRFIVDDAQGKGANRIFTMHQGRQSTREWLTEWQKRVTILNLDIPFVHLRREFFQRSVDALSTALGERSLSKDFDQIVEKACEVIQTNQWAANER